MPIQSRHLSLLLPCLLLAGAAVALPRGQNLLANPGFEQPGVWAAYGSGFAVDQAVSHSGHASLRLEGANTGANAGAVQRLDFDPPLEGPLHLSGWSKAESAVGIMAGHVYGPYLDLTYADGTPLWGQQLSFSDCIHDWEFRETTIVPAKPVKSILFHVLLRGMQGKVWIDDLSLELLPFKFGEPQALGSTDKRGTRVALRAEANMPATWSLHVSQHGREFPAVEGKGKVFTAACEGLRPGQVELALEAADTYRGDKQQWRRTLEVPDHPVPPWLSVAPPSDTVSAVEQHDTVSAEVAGLRGEAESLQLVLTSPLDVEGVDVAVTDLKSAAGVVISKSNVTLRRVVEVQGYPDALLPYRPLHLRPWEHSVLWLTVHVPPDAKPGLYEGGFVLAAEDRPTGPHPFRLRVWDAQLPVRPGLPAVVGIADTMFSEQLGLKEGTPEWSETLAQWYALLKSYRVSPYFCRFNQPEPNHYAYPAPWPIGDPRADPYLSAPDQAAYAITHPLGGDETQLRRTLEYLQQKGGWLGRGFLYLWDEPNRTVHYEKLKQWAAKVHAIAPAARVLTTYYCGPLDGPDKDKLEAVPELLRGATQIFCMSQWATAGRDDYRQKLALRPDEQWWLYVCCGPGYPQPNLYLGGPSNANRAVMWRLYTEGAEGFLYWCANAQVWTTKPGQAPQFREGGPPGDGVLTYPGESFGEHGPVPSIRLERLRDSLEDYEYLKLYEGRFGRAKTLECLQDLYRPSGWYRQDAYGAGMWRERVAGEMGWR